MTNNAFNGLAKLAAQARPLSDAEHLAAQARFCQRHSDEIYELCADLDPDGDPDLMDGINLAKSAFFSFLANELLCSSIPPGIRKSYAKEVAKVFASFFARLGAATSAEDFFDE